MAGALAALELLVERPHRVARLRSNARALRRALAEEGFPVAESEMQIVPLIVGEERAALRLCQQALERGVFAQAIRPPTVPAGTSRLRLTAMASHTPAELRDAAEALGAAARRAGLEPEAAPRAGAGAGRGAGRDRDRARARRTALAARPRTRRAARRSTPSVHAGGPFDQHASARAGAAPAARGRDRAGARAGRGGRPTELFDFERAA